MPTLTFRLRASRFLTALQFALLLFFYNRVERAERVALDLRNDVK
jgi:hypothetical protein